MGALFRRSSSIVRSARMRSGAWDPTDDRWYIGAPWLGQMTASGQRVSPELALTVSAIWRATFGIMGDVSTLPCQVFRYLDDGGKERTRTHPLAYPLRWQPNQEQTAQQFFGMTVGHQLLRGNAYWEIVAGLRGFADQLVPRHPDRVQKERSPSGRPLYRLIRGNSDGTDRILSSDEMVHVPDLLTFDGWLGASRIAYGMNSIGGMLGAEHASQTFFSTGMTAGVVATHKGGELDPEELKNIHSSLQLYAGSKNQGGVLIIEEDLAIQKLGIEPEKAQLLATRQHSVKDVARWFGYPGHKLESDGQTQAYAAREQANLEYVIGCIRPILIGLEQIVQKDLILDKDAYFVEFLMDALFRGDLKSQAEYYAKAIQFGWMNRNEVRLRSNLNPAEGLDRFLEPENMRDADPEVAAANREDRDRSQQAKRIGQGQSAGVRASLLAYEAGLRIVRKEKAAVTKAAEKFAKDGAGWSAWLREFYADHAGFVASTLKVPLKQAREYAAEHGTVLEQQGVKAMEDWEPTVATELAVWALEGVKAAA
jgi:HK97 family phage portal protein